MVREDTITGRDALHMLDNIAAGAREQFDAAVAASESFSRRRSDLARLKADGYRQLAAMRLDVIKDGEAAKLSAVEAEAQHLLEQHERFIASIGTEVTKAADALTGGESRRREVEKEVDDALHAYEALTTQVEKDIQTDPGYVALKKRFEDSHAIAARAEQKADLARTDRKDKGAPYESDPLFSYLWQRKFRTPEYNKGGLTRLLDGWVGRLCHYDQAYLNYARLVELPDRLAEHVANMRLEEAETQAAIEKYEAAKMEERGSGPLQATLDAARAKLKALDAELSAAESKYSDLRGSQQKAASGDAGPREQARRILEEGLAKASFPDLRVLAAETTNVEDDRIVDVLIKLRTEELQMEVNWRNVDALPARRRAGADTLEGVRRRFKEAGLDSPYVLLLRGAFQAALQAYGGPEPDGERLWKAIIATVRQAPMDDDDYFGGRRRGRSIGLPGVIAGVVLGEVIKGAVRGGGRWGGGGWGGGWGGGFGGGGFGGGGGGGFGGGGFKTGGKF